MKKIFNWTFGGFFRTIGRTLAFLVLGALFYYILSISNIGIKDLFLDNVKAESYTSGVWSTYYRNRTTQLEYDSAKGYWYTTTTNFPVYLFFNNENSQAKGMPLPSNATKVRFHLRILSYNSNPTLQYVYNSYTIGTYYDKGGLTYCNTVQANNYNINQLNYTNQLDLTLECPIVKTSSVLSVIFIRGNDTSQGYPFRIDINPNYTFQYDDTSQGIQGVIQEQQNTNSAINNQTQTIQETSNQTQQTIKEEVNKTIETITDSSSPDLNGTLDNNTIAGWLPAGPIDSIVTLPLTLLNSLFNAMGGTCADLTVPLPFVNKDLSIPCMSRVYNDMSFGSFFNWIGIVASAFILYKYLLRLYKWIDATLTLRENTQVDWGGD